MTLTIHKEEDTQRQLLMTIEVAETRVEEAMKQLARKLARDIHMPGFRRGKAPYRVMVNRIGRDALRSEAIEELVQPVFEEAMAEIDDVEVYGRPELTDMELEPLVLKFTIPLQPHVELGDYREMRQEIEPVVITDEAVDEALERIREKHQVLEEVERPLGMGDMATLSGTGRLVPLPDEAEDEAAEAAEAEAEAAETAVPEPTAAADESAADEFDEDDAYDDDEYDDDEYDDDDFDEYDDDDADDIIFSEERIELPLDPKRTFAGTPFVDYLVGLSAGDESTFRFTFPDDYENEELAGREAIFEISILNVQSRQLPELDDELAREEGDYESVEALRGNTRAALEEAAIERAKSELVDEMVEALVARAEVVYPPAAVDVELDGMIDNLKNQTQRSGWEWDDFMRLQGLTEEQMRDSFRETAVARLKRNVVMRQFVLNEKLTVDMADLDAAIAEKVASFGDNEELRQGMADYYRSGYGLDVISGEILQEKVYERVHAIYTGQAPDLAALESEEAASDEEE